MRLRVAVCSLAMVALVSIGFSAGSPPGAATHGPSATPETSAPFSDSWVIVRLRESLEHRLPDGAFSLSTGHPGIDSAVADFGVHRIDRALRVSTRDTRHAEALRRAGFDRVYRFHVPPGTDIRRFVARLAGLSEVEYAQPDLIYRLQGATVPDDPFYPNQWAYYQASDADVDGPEAWSITTGVALKIAVVDTGVDPDHPDLVTKIDPGWDFVNDDAYPDDDYGHGTLVSSIAAAATNNTTGIAGTCWKCRILPLKALNENGTSLGSWVADAFVWAADHGAAVINFSAGVDNDYHLVPDAIRYARAAGVVLVAASGNYAGAIAFPARHPEVIAVGATTNLDRVWTNSRVGRYLENVAPGVGIVGAGDGGGYVIADGTSLAAPLVAGLVGLIGSVHPAPGGEEVRELLHFGAEDQVGLPSEDTPGWDRNHGWGRVNMHASLLGAQATSTLHVDGKVNTRPYYGEASAVATSYDFVRGDLADLTVGPDGVELGDVVCLENDSPDPDTTGSEDTGSPLPGQAFFYLGRFNSGPWPGSFGASSERRDRFVRSETGADWIVDGESVESGWGAAVAGAGDVNGDGYDDLIVGASRTPTPAAALGSAYVYLGSAAGLAATPAWEVQGSQLDAGFGAAVSSAGDVNGDGYDDVIVGQPRYDLSPVGDEGRAYVYLGSATGLSGTPHRVYEGSVGEGLFGSRVAGAGDVNGDGFDEVIISAPALGNGEANEGRVYLYNGSASGLSTVPTWTFESDQANARLGEVADAPGDVDNDGYDDIVVAAASYDAAENNQGRVWVFRGGIFGPTSSPTTILEVDLDTVRFGSNVTIAKDLNGDDRDDVVVSAARYSNGEFEEGGAFVYFGTTGGVSTTPAWSFETDQYQARVSQVAAAGDVDGDGHGDLLVGSSYYYWTRPCEGRVWLFSGTASGPQTSPAWAEIGRQAYADYGFRVVGIGDVNDDGYADVAVGADEFETTEFNAGRIYVYYGSATGLAGPEPIHACDERPPDPGAPAPYSTPGLQRRVRPRRRAPSFSVRWRNTAGCEFHPGAFMNDRSPAVRGSISRSR